MSATLKIYDNGVSLEVGVSNETGNVYFQSRCDIDADESIDVELEDEELDELILFLQRKRDNKLVQKAKEHPNKD